MRWVRGVLLSFFDLAVLDLPRLVSAIMPSVH